MDANKKKREKRLRRHRRVRGRVAGTAAQPRLAIFRSNRQVYCQVIDDEAGKTLASASSVSKETAGDRQGNSKEAAAVGDAIAKKCKEIGVSKVCFDRGGFRYHGRVKALADAARKGGLQF